MTIRPIDIQVVVAQQSAVAGVEQSQQNMASQIQAQQLQKIPAKTHERETQVQKGGESNAVKVKEKEPEGRKQGARGKKKQGQQQAKNTETTTETQEEGKGVRLDVTT